MVNNSEYLDKMICDIQQHKRDIGYLVVSRGERCDDIIDCIEKKIEVGLTVNSSFNDPNKVHSVLSSLRSAFDDMIDNVFKDILSGK